MDLNLFEFDYDLTFMVFFLNADAKVYARYGGRDAKDADNRQSLDGLHYTMKSVLAMHEREAKEFAPKTQEEPRFIRGMAGPKGGGRCMHCHQVRESLNGSLRRSGDWERDMIYRYPLPENVGLQLEVDRGNVVKQVRDASPAAGVGIQAGDVLRRLGNVPIHSFGDAQFALDRAPKEGTLDITWQRGDQLLTASLPLAPGWRKTDVTWRASLRRQLASARLFGNDLTPEEKQGLGLSAKQLAFRHKDYVHAQAESAGVRPGDIILGVNDEPAEMGVSAFQHYIHMNYLIGERVTVNLIREGKRLSLPMTFVR